MKKSIVLLIIFLLLSVSVYAGTDPSRWEGFRGLKWATNIKDMNDPNMILIEDGNELKTYRRLSDKLSIGDAKLEAIAYSFYKDRFFGLTIRAKGYTNFNVLKDAIFAYYGEGMQENQYITKWMWLSFLENSSIKVFMVLEYNEFSEETSLGMIYNPITDEMNADEAKKAKEASKDF